MKPGHRAARNIPEWAKARPRDWSKARVVDRLKTNGAREFGVRYLDGHIAWLPSLPHAMAAYYDATVVGPRR